MAISSSGSVALLLLRVKSPIIACRVRKVHAGDDGRCAVARFQFRLSHGGVPRPAHTFTNITQTGIFRLPFGAMALRPLNEGRTLRFHGGFTVNVELR